MLLRTYSYSHTKLIAFFISFWIFAGAHCTLQAQYVCAIDEVDAGRQGDSVQISVCLKPDAFLAVSQSVITLTPVIMGTTDSIVMPKIHILGREAYYRYLRHDNLGIISDNDIVLRNSRRSPFNYIRTIKYEPWMEEASLKLFARTAWRCEIIDNCLFMQRRLGKDFIADVPPTVEERDSSISKKIYVVFPLSNSEVNPSLGNNRTELLKIKTGIDEIRSDKKNSLKGIEIKGYASPDGPYANNARLARERTQSLVDYVAANYDVDRRIITTAYEPEDWAGLRRFIVEATDEQLEYRHALLAIIDSQLTPDEKEQRMRTFYPKDFAYLMENCLPKLRHSDYRIDFKMRVLVETRHARKDTLLMLPFHGDSYRKQSRQSSPYNALFALKTNLLFDLALAPNVEVEFPLGKKNRWSFMAEYWTPWYVWHHNSRAYELQLWGVELRKWLGECRERRPKLTGTFLGYYLAIAKYDFEWNSVGDQGELISGGITLGHSWTISRHWNLEASISAGALWGPRRHYNGEFDDSHLIWKNNKNLFYAGPTKAKISLVWMIGRKAKEGRR